MVFRARCCLRGIRVFWRGRWNHVLLATVALWLEPPISRGDVSFGGANLERICRRASLISDSVVSRGVFPRPSAAKFRDLQIRASLATTRCRPASANQASVCQAANRTGTKMGLRLASWTTTLRPRNLRMAVRNESSGPNITAGRKSIASANAAQTASSPSPRLRLFVNLAPLT